MPISRETITEGGLPTRKGYLYRPQADITAYELAQITPILIRGLNIHNTDRIVQEGLVAEIEDLPSEVKRHFELQES